MRALHVSRLDQTTKKVSGIIAPPLDYHDDHVLVCNPPLSYNLYRPTTQ